jgi:lactoylglutathione lyase
MKTLHVGLRVSDLERSVAFYAKLGYLVLGTVPETEFGTLAMLKLPDDEFVSLELVHDPGFTLVDGQGLNHVVVQVEKMSETLAELSELGIEAGEPRSPDGSDDFWTAWLTDPDGYRIELVQWPTGHPVGMTQADVAEDVAEGVAGEA